ncbi:MAG: hypothetical protein FVQ84_07975 [Planctomycetes bacterium]|nr:hypothetical protein [Planctomycetota bacterium]
MEESKKKAVMIGIIVVCLGVAGVIIFGTGSGGGGSLDDIPDDEMTWVKCLNKSCNAEYEMSRKEYFKFVTANANPMAPSAPALTCEKCDEPSVYVAEKCQNAACGIVFRSGAVPNDFPDRCPTCKQSATEEIRNARKREMAGG